LDSEEYRHNTGVFASPPPNFAHPLVSTAEGASHAPPMPHLTPRSASFASVGPRVAHWYRSLLSHFPFLPLAWRRAAHVGDQFAAQAQAELQALLAQGHTPSADDQLTTDMLKRV